MIDFNETYEFKGIVYFCNDGGQTLRTYTMKDIEYYIWRNQLNVESQSANGKNQFDPECIEEDIELPIEQYIDDNWYEVTELFYNSVNKTGYTANNNEQNTLRDIS